MTAQCRTFWKQPLWSLSAQFAARSAHCTRIVRRNVDFRIVIDYYWRLTARMILPERVGIFGRVQPSDRKGKLRIYHE